MARTERADMALAEGYKQMAAARVRVIYDAAQRGVAQEMCNLGFCYDFGVGVETSQQLAVHWYLLGSIMHHPFAIYNLADSYQQGTGIHVDHDIAAKLYKLLADENFATGIHALACCYRDGEGVAQNHTEAAKLYLRAAEMGHPPSQYDVAVCYMEGKGLVKNISRATLWLQRCHDNGRVSVLKLLQTLKSTMGRLGTG